MTTYTQGLKDGLRAASGMLVLTYDEIRLACGEMTAQEMRTVIAVLEWRKRAILNKAEKINHQLV